MTEHIKHAAQSPKKNIASPQIAQTTAKCGLNGQVSQSPALILELQSTCGNYFVQRLIKQQKTANANRPIPITQVNQNRVVQRNPTPKLSATIGWGWFEDKEKLAPVFRNTLILLKAQLKHFKPQDQDVLEKEGLIGQVDSFFKLLEKNADIKPEHVDNLIDSVNIFTASAPKVEASTLRSLDNVEEGKFDTLIELAINRANTAKDATPALEATFTAKTDPLEKKAITDVASNNFGEIAAHLLDWKTHKKTRVQINTASTGYGGYNRGTGNDSSLVMNSTAFDDQTKSSNTLIHEASHGKVETRDLGYIGAPYFFAMPDHFRLKNADHYSFATQLAHGEVLNPLGAQPNAVNALDDFIKAKDLAYYKADRTWTYLMWMVDTYGGETYVPPETLKKHAKWIGLENRSSTEINKANARLLVKVYSYIRGFLAKNLTYPLDPVVVTTVIMTPQDNTKAIKVANVLGQNVDTMSGLIFDALCEPYGIPPQWNIHKIGMKLFKRLFVKEKDLRQGDKPKPFEKELYTWFGGA